MSDEDLKTPYQQLTCFNSDRLVLMVKDPGCLYAYWDISDDINEKFIKEFGDDIWQKSTPALKVTNVSQNSSFIINIGDATDCMYINVTNSSSLYFVELGRLISENYFICLLKSNYAVTPTDNISSNSAAFFVNCMTMYEDWQFTFLENPYDYYLQDQFNDSLGLSSMQLMGNFKNYLGLSSMQLIENARKHSGLSSYSYFTEEGNNFE